jgi:UDP-glucose 4-epimerase
MRTVVTGGAGFIGSALVRLLLERGHQVVVLDDFSTGKEENLAGLGDGLTMARGSIADAAFVDRCVEGADGIFHLAAVASVQKSLDDPLGCHEVNVTGALNVLAAAKKTGAKRVVFSSSAAVYGEADAFPLAESVPCRPISPYGLHKQINEEYARLYAERGWVETVCLRYFNIYGPRQDPNGDYAAVVPKFITAVLSGGQPVIFGDGKQSRDFMYVEDVAAMNLRAMTAPAISGRIFNICAGVETDLLGLLDAIRSAAGSPVEPRFEPVREGDIRRSVGSDAAIRTALSPPPWTSVREGLARTVEWYRHGRAH